MSTQPISDSPPPQPVWLGLRRGFVGRCPNCGQGHLYRAYLKVQACEVCGHDNTVYPADDAPPYFTILIVGHLVIAPLLVLPFIWRAPTALVLATILPALAVVTLLVLPRVKGAVIGVHWALKHKMELQATEDGAASFSR